MPGGIDLPLTEPETTLVSGLGALVRRSVLPGGVRVLSEQLPASASTAIGFWVPVGSRDEVPGTYGSTHFLEHLLFKGTPSRSAFEISETFERVGGSYNAVTECETTGYYAKVREADVPMAIEVLCDMITSSVIDPVEFETERGVILEELAEAEDDPGDYAFTQLASLVFSPETGLDRPVGGARETVEAATRDRLFQHYREFYRPDTLVVAAAGAVDHDRLVADVLEGLERGGWALTPGQSPVARRSSTPAPPPPGGTRTFTRPIEQVHVALGMEGIPFDDERRDPMAILNEVYGYGMTSRLSQEIREKRGLAYFVHSYSDSYSDAGFFGAYTATAPKNAQEALDIIRRELERVANDGITERELENARSAIAGKSALALERSEVRLRRLVNTEVHLGRFIDYDTRMEQIAQVTNEDIQALAGQLLAGPQALVAVGAVPDGLH